MPSLTSTDSSARDIGTQGPVRKDPLRVVSTVILPPTDISAPERNSTPMNTLEEQTEIACPNMTSDRSTTHSISSPVWLFYVLTTLSAVRKNKPKLRMHTSSPVVSG